MELIAYFADTERIIALSSLHTEEEERIISSVNSNQIHRGHRPHQALSQLPRQLSGEHSRNPQEGKKRNCGVRSDCWV